MFRCLSSTVAATVLFMSGVSAQQAVSVPRGAAVTIDGAIADAEWRNAAVQTLPDGTMVRLQHDTQYLFLGITASRPGFSSVCVAKDDVVQVLHASAALGRVSYSRREGRWNARETEFVYGLRRTDLTDEAQAERRAYLAKHGWLASTARMGDGRTQELQIPLTFLSRPGRLALAYFALNGNEPAGIIRWPESLPQGDGCVKQELVSGRVPRELPFDPGAWASLDIVP